MGAKRGLLGYMSTLLLLQWMRERLIHLEDFLIVECVVGFDHTVFKLIDQYYELHVLMLTPMLFLVPIQRQRKYMTLLKKGSLRLHPCIASDVPGAFMKLFRQEGQQESADMFSMLPSKLSVGTLLPWQGQGRCLLRAPMDNRGVLYLAGIERR